MDSFYTDIFDKLALGIILIDKNQNVILWNKWMEKKTESKSTSILGQKFSDVCPKFKEPKYQNILDTIFKTGQARFLAGALHGSFFHLAAEVNNVYNLQNLQIEQIVLDSPDYLLIQVVDVTCQYQKVHHIRRFINTLEIENVEIRQSELEARSLAMRDGLTGLPNRMVVMDRLNEIIRNADKNNGCTAVIYLDIDNFKSINDTFGHSTGDSLLKLTAQRLKSAVRETDLVARIAGDEFILIIQGIRSKDQIILAANRIIQQFNEPFDFDEDRIDVTCSFGISLYPIDGKDFNSLIDKADVALYRVKKDKKADYQFYSNQECDVI